MFTEDYWTQQDDHRLAPFHIQGEVVPVNAEAMAKGVGRSPRRPLAGWLMVYATLGADGEVNPMKDRQGHVHEIAKELGHIDWTPYLEKGTWIDNHAWLFPDGTRAPHGVRPEGGSRVHIGRAHTLEFHDGTTTLSMSHRKVGFFTTGELFDRKDPTSWAGLGRSPSPEELDRSDYYWDLAHMLKGTPRPLAFSADGLMALSKDKAQILWARVDAAGVCEVPQHPATTAEVMTMSAGAFRDTNGPPPSPMEIMAKAIRTDSLMATGPSPLTEGEVERKAHGVLDQQTTNPGSTRLDTLVELVMDQFDATRPKAVKWVRNYFKANPHRLSEVSNETRPAT